MKNLDFIAVNLYIWELRILTATEDWNHSRAFILGSWENNAWKKHSGLNEIQIHLTYIYGGDTSAVIYQLSSQAIWELVVLFVIDLYFLRL